MLKRLFSTLLLICLVGGPAKAATFAEELAAQLVQGAGTAATDDQAESLVLLEPFYRGRSMKPLWVNQEGASDRARQLSRLLSEANLDGLDPDDYGAQAITPLLKAVRADLLAELELRLSLGLIQLASDLGEGRTAPNIADPALFPLRDEVDKAEVIAGVAEAADLAAYIDGYRPQTPRYDRMVATLADYRALAAAGGWEPLAEGPVLKPDMTQPRVAALRARLKLWGDLQDEDDLTRSGGDPTLYDEGLVQAVKEMQRRHGLDRDGVIGKATLAALNIPVERRIEQLVLNLERRRWMADDFGQRYIFVNLADFVLKLVDEPKTLLDMRVVIGKTYHKTPVFSEKMTYVEINPYWNVPPSIAGGEILPKLKENANYLTEKNFTLFSDWGASAQTLDPLAIDWARITRKTFAYKLRQGPGDGNALGRIKFMFPNRFNVYLHDTPAKSLFKKAKRSFSHGCIRVEDPPGLAAVVLAKTQGWTAERIHDAIASGQRQVVSLAAPLPVHISYLTAFVNKDGSVHFRDDIYGRDARLAEVLLGTRATQIAD